MTKPSADSPLRGVSLVDAIRAEIIAGRLEPGQRITEPALATQFGVSRVPIREALRVLVSEGFVQLKPYGSASVAEIDQSVADDLMEIRAVIEPLAARRAARLCAGDDARDLLRIVADAHDAIHSGDSDRLAQLNVDFHRAIADLSGNSFVAQSVAQLSSKMAWVYSSGVVARATDSWKEHADIARAILDGDETLAAERMSTHILTATREAIDEATGISSVAG